MRMKCSPPPKSSGGSLVKIRTVRRDMGSGAKGLFVNPRILCGRGPIPQVTAQGSENQRQRLQSRSGLDHCQPPQLLGGATQKGVRAVVIEINLPHTLLRPGACRRKQAASVLREDPEDLLGAPIVSMLLQNEVTARSCDPHSLSFMPDIITHATNEFGFSSVAYKMASRLETELLKL